jgi:DNA invertase Pin-like site-specific DNA recombinase
MGQTTAAIYARVSTEEQARGGYSLDDQIKEAQEFAADEGFDTLIYRDDGVSGAKRRRPALDRLLSDAAKGLFQIVIVRHVDRLSRDAEFSLHLSNLLHTHGVAIWALNEGMRDTAGKDRLTYGIRSLVAEEERRRTIERMMSGKAASARLGHHHGGETPLGTLPVPCDRHPGCKSRILVENPEEARFIRQAARWAIDEGASKYEIARRWNAAGFRSRRGKEWTRQLVGFALRNPRLTGVAPSWGNVIDVPQILSPVEFSRMQTALSRHTVRYQQGKYGPRQYYPLTGRILCGCGRHWTGGARKGKRWYKCSLYPDCPWYERRWLSADIVENGVTELLWQDFVGDPVLIYAAVHDYLSSAEVDPAVLTAAQEVESSKLKEYTALLRMQITEGIDPEGAAIALSEVASELAQAREVVQSLESQRIGVQLGEEWWKETVVTETVQKVKDWLDAGDLGKVVDLLGIRIRLTGRNTFELSSWVEIGPQQVEVMLRPTANI